MNANDLFNSVQQLQETVQHMTAFFDSGGSTLRSYGIEGFTEYLILIALPLVLYFVLDHHTKPRR